MTSATLPPAPPTLRSLLESMKAHGLTEHGTRVAALSAELCSRLGLSKRPLSVITTAALLHDVGRLGEVDGGSLAVRSQEMLRDVDGLVAVAGLVRHVHERWDGRGGPDRLRRDRIPLGARIIATADAWDTLIFALPEPEAVTALRFGAGAQWDPKIVAELIAHVSNGRGH
jgi:response regulator RpfG family c-di-GMP phosphodiesterase